MASDPESGASINLQSTRYSEYADLTVLTRPVGVDSKAGGGPGVYRARVNLAKPGDSVYRDNINFVDLATEGDSLLAVPVGWTALMVRAGNGQAEHELWLVKNAASRLAAIELDVNAASVYDAETAALDITLPLLSWWSVRFDVALAVSSWLITEAATGDQRASLGVLGGFRELLAPLDAVELTPEIRTLVAAYRQGLTATDLFVGVLSFWRVIEGVRALRKARSEQAKKSGIVVATDPLESIPNSKTWLAKHESWTQPLFEPYLGKRYTAVTELLRPTLRNALAHMDPAGVVLSLDQNADRVACQKAIPVLRLVARTVLRAELGGSGGLGALMEP